MTFWYHYKEDILCFTLIPKSSSYTSCFLKWLFMHKTILKWFLLKFNIVKSAFKFQIDLDKTGCGKLRFFLWENVQKTTTSPEIHRCDRKLNVKNIKTSKSTEELLFSPVSTLIVRNYISIGYCDFFTPVSTLIVHISQ